MDTDNTKYLKIDNSGRLVLPSELRRTYNIKPGSRIRVIRDSSSLQIELPSRLAKLYIEPTSLCNLECRTCIRNNWDEPVGKMSMQIFRKIIDDLRAFPKPLTIFFGGFGEPLFHPDIVEMVTCSKASGASVELVTNGTLLTENLSRDLIRSGLDMLWVSLDGATPESYADIRLGAALPKVLENLYRFRKTVNIESGSVGYYGVNPTRLGIVFVAMRRNIADLPAIITIGRQFGAERFLVTNVLPYTREMANETLYTETINNRIFEDFSLPVMDIEKISLAPVYQATRKIRESLAGIFMKNVRNRCPFITDGAAAISWDGNLSPCLPLMHSHTSYFKYLEYDTHFSRRWIIGNIMECSLRQLWDSPEHLTFRERVQTFDFSPCTVCGSCDLLEKNEEDCFDNIFPTCGACLWAQGAIRCP